MSDQTSIEWTDATCMIDREGRRIRYYQRANPSKPGQQLRRQMAAQGLRWCRHCSGWLPIAQVTKNGLCRPHENADYRRRYAEGGKKAIAQRIHARKRNVAPVPVALQDDLLEKFDGSCAYCGTPANTWDHVEPITKGGQTERGNIVPACNSCNSSKGNRDLDTWLQGRNPSDLLIDEIVMMEVL